MAVRCVIGAPSAAPRRRADRPRLGSIIAGALCALLLVALGLAWNLWLAPGRARSLSGREAAVAREFERAARHRADVIRQTAPRSPDAPGA